MKRVPESLLDSSGRKVLTFLPEPLACSFLGCPIGGGRGATGFMEHAIILWSGWAPCCQGWGVVWGGCGVPHLEPIGAFLKSEAKDRLPAWLLQALEWFPT